MLKKLLGLSVLFTCLLFSACSGTDTGAGTGSLEITADGLSDVADILVTGPDGFSQMVKAGTILDNLRSGDYQLSLAGSDETLIETAGLAQSFHVSAGEVTTASFIYYVPSYLKVVINSPKAIPYPYVRVWNSSGQLVKSLSQSSTFRLSSGTYRITAPSFDVGGLCKPVWIAYVPQPSSQTKTVPWYGTVTATINYQEIDLGGNDGCPEPPRGPIDPEPSPPPYF